MPTYSVRQFADQRWYVGYRNGWRGWYSHSGFDTEAEAVAEMKRLNGQSNSGEQEG